MTSGTAPTIPGWYVEFQANVLRQLPRPGKLDQATAEGLSNNQRLLKARLRQVLVLPSSPLLDEKNVVTVPATREQFVVNERFVIDSGLNISWVTKRFKELFGDKIEKPMEETKLRHASLVKSSVDDLVLAELGENAETTLSQIAQLLKLQQPYRQEGALLANGWTNIFYVRDAGDSLCTVTISRYGGGWKVDAYLAEHAQRLYADRVFSRSS